MSDKFLGVSQILELLHRLKGTVSDFTAAETRLDKASRVAKFESRRTLEEGIKAQDTRLSEAIDAANSSFQSARDEVVSRFEQRGLRISHAYKNSRERLLNATASREGKRKIAVQAQALETNRSRETHLADADKKFREFSESLAEEAAAFERLQTRARRSFGEYGNLRQQLAEAAQRESAGAPDPSRDENLLAEDFRELLRKAEDELATFRKSPLPLLFKLLPVSLLTVLIVVGHAALVPLMHQFDHLWISWWHAGASMLVSLALVIVLHLNLKRRAGPAAAAVAGHLVSAGKLLEICTAKSKKRHDEECARIENEVRTQSSLLDREWRDTEEEAAAVLGSGPEKIDAQARRLTARHEELYREKLETLEPDYLHAVARLKEESESHKKELTAAFEKESAEHDAKYRTGWEQLEADWKIRIQEIYDAIDAAGGAAGELFPDWTSSTWQNWTPPEEFRHVAKFARLEVDVEEFSGAVPKDARLALPAPARFSVPLMLKLPDQGSILFEAVKSGDSLAMGALNNIILRLLSTAPPGRLSFTIMDPVGLGENFAGIMHLADYEEHLINSRIWTQAAHIEQKLADLNEHMEKVIQMYLRNEYETITQYNEKAGNIAEKYHFLVIADFPSGFSEIAMKRLHSIATSGARCGVYTLIHWDHRNKLQQDFIADDLRRSSVWISCGKNGLTLSDKAVPGNKLILDTPPNPDFAIEFINRVGQSSIDSNRVEVPFSHVAPQDDALWSTDTTDELRVPIGRTGATKSQYLAIGKGTRQHTLIAGKTGSGKSTLFHVMITNLSLWCSPEQVEFYLVDFKKGVEFKAYASARLPHARVIAIESDREFGLSVLQRVDDELKRRGDMFRELGVQDIAGYKKTGGKEPMPRSLLMIDEFQEFFVEDDRISQNAAVLLDRIVRQGRAFGIHVLLGSQTLGGAFTLARTTLGQMVIRIALQCNEADSYLIMDDNNPAPRLLTRPGEGIYNDTAGTMEGNSPFQVVWLSDEVRQSYLDKVRRRADGCQNSYPDPIVFEGNVPADVRENPVLQNLLEAESVESAATSPRAWLGAPNSIKGPTEAVFHRQSGNNLLIVGQRDEAALAILAVSLVSLATQFPRGSVRLLILDGSPPGSPHREVLEKVIAAVPHEVEVLKGGDIGDVINSLAAEMRARSDDPRAGEAPSTFLFVHGLQKFKKLRFEEDFGFSVDDTQAPANPGVEFDNLIREGASLGFHVVASCDTYNNVNRFLSRKALSEFEMRVLFQMSANDSASLIDTPKAGNLGLNRALFYNEQEGYLETFRPYALPGNDWIEDAAGNLARLLPPL